MNLFFRKNSKIKYDKKTDIYFKQLTKELKISYPNKRITRVIQKYHTFFFEKLFKTYCLDQISFEKGDTVIDCGANVGEINFSFYLNEIQINYIGIEPDIDTFVCLEKNKIKEEDKFYQIALSNKSGKQMLYLDSVGGNSSLEYFGKNDQISVNTMTLDSLNIMEKIKLLKVEAEGHEPEVLEGSMKTLEKTQYVSVDFGFERGVEQTNTVKAVNHLLTNNGFVLKDISKYRMIGLYENLKLEVS
tara:strand:+ start:56 stop:790 length:735 start_codon:yes stop_codon:yes gene_type:complete